LGETFYGEATTPIIREEMTMFTFRTNPPATYLTPSAEEMRNVAKAVGLGTYSRDLASDLAHLAAGGTINPPSRYREVVRAGVEEKFPSPNANGEWKIKNGTFTKDRGRAVAKGVESAFRYHQTVCDFLEAVDFTNVPGDTPLEQAMNLLKLLSKKKGGAGGGENGETLPIFADEKIAGEKPAEELNKLLDDVESMSWEEAELLSPDKIETDADGGETLSAMDLAEDMLSGKEEMLRISRNLDSLSRMQVRRQRNVETDPSGDDVRKRPIAHMGELAKVGSADWALRQAAPSLFLYKAVTKALPIRERVVTVERRQLLYIIIDCSGSMKEGKRIFKAGGILMNRLKAVIAGEAELYVRLFDTQLKAEYHAGTPAEARELVRHFTTANYSGGSTDISSCARAARKRIDEIIAQGTTCRPELVVITDGDDKISLTAKEFAGTKVHAFVVETKNDALIKVAQATGGVGINNL